MSQPRYVLNGSFRMKWYALCEIFIHHATQEGIHAAWVEAIYIFLLEQRSTVAGA